MKTQNPISAKGTQNNVAGYVGEITWFVDNILRKNHVWADGAAIDSAKYPELADHAKKANWKQNENGQYLVPDLRGKFLLNTSVNYAVGSEGGAATHSLTLDEMPAHFHLVTYASHGQNTTSGGSFISRFNADADNVTTSTEGKGAPHNNMPPYYTGTAQIRAKVDRVVAYVPGASEIAEDALEVANTAISTISSLNIWSNLTFTPSNTSNVDFFVGYSNEKLGVAIISARIDSTEVKGGFVIGNINITLKNEFTMPAWYIESSGNVYSARIKISKNGELVCISARNGDFVIVLNSTFPA